jgi:UDP-N-acetylglucosamine--N-acetylmuramyl-(pentapeptide) pyrophosphoryl-undecaprenol N-acetylglucosamine transferase
LSELCLIGKPALLIPSPNVAEDHQTHNARALSEKGAAILVSEKDMEERFLEELASMQTQEIAEKMSAAIKRLALPKATSDIADLIDGLGE